MPEMPEVETVRRTLEPLIKGKIISNVTIWYDKIIVNDADFFQRKVVGQKILAIDRYGKYLLIRLTNNLTIVSHLRMEGKYHFLDSDAPKQKHEHIQFAFSDNTYLRYDDVRKFGRMQLIETGTERRNTGIKNLGFEPNSEDFTLDFFLNRVKARKRAIKNVLLDQSIVCGLGNIYTDEVLWQSKIHPLSIANKIAQDSLVELFYDINNTIKIAIQYHGTTFHSFLDADGHTGKYQSMLKVYGKSGEPCSRCNTTLEKIKVNGRGTTFCPLCQVVYK